MRIRANLWEVLLCQKVLCFLCVLWEVLLSQKVLCFPCVLWEAFLNQKSEFRGRLQFLDAEASDDAED